MEEDEVTMVEVEIFVHLVDDEGHRLSLDILTVTLLTQQDLIRVSLSTILVWSLLILR